MGAGSSVAQGADVEVSLFDFQYQKERADLRKALISSFLNNSKFKDVAEKIGVMRKLLTQHQEICATAKREADHNASPENMPTNIQAAFHELDRLMALYETSTVLKSVQCRIGPVACPLGHYAGYVDDFTELAPKGQTLSCHICLKGVQNGHHCGYCEYNLCVPCSVIYCHNGHAMKLWTHAESQHSCVVCKQQPITSGYRCLECDDYDICDMCTYLPGRKAVQKVILDRIDDDVAYMQAHTHESETAHKTFDSHSRKITGGSYATTKHLFDFSVEIKELRVVVKAEVRQFRIMKAIEKLREELCVGREYSRTALVESLVEECFTIEELRRLRKLKEWYDELKSVSRRCHHPIACPLGHVALPYSDGPPPYVVPAGPPPSLSEEQIASTANLCTAKKPTHNASVCKICDRLALPQGAHCMYCDYSLCSICSVIYCGKGHRMTLWTEPAAQETCFLCKRTDVTSGYRCTECAVDLCDACTTKENRDRVRTDWDKEVGTLMGFMKKNRRDSDIAMFYQWRHATNVVSMGLLVDYVQELRTAKSQAEKQIEQKPIIDKIKVLRGEICKHADLCATAARESVTNENFVFPSRKKAAQELNRLALILKEMIMAQSPERRLAAGVACPLAHAMDPLGAGATLLPLLRPSSPLTPARRSEPPPQSPSSLALPFPGSPQRPATPASKVVTLPAIVEEPSPPATQKLHEVTPLSATSAKESELLRPLKQTQAAQIQRLEQAMNTIAVDFPGSPFSTQHRRACSVCDTQDLAGGHGCSICEYYLCVDCSVVFCRMGHRTKIWTLHDAHHMTCDVCKKSPITSGYRCMTCQTDICDLCTTRESRNAFLLWPKRELHKTVQALEMLRPEAAAAGSFLDAFAAKDPHYEHVMSRLCKVLQEAQEALTAAQAEVKRKVDGAKAHKYGALRSREML